MHLSWWNFYQYQTISDNDRELTRHQSLVGDSLDWVGDLKPLFDGIIRKMTSDFENIALDRVKVRLGLTEAQWTSSMTLTS